LTSVELCTDGDPRAFRDALLAENPRCDEVIDAEIAVSES
jgi:hypothetical protein